MHSKNDNIKVMTYDNQDEIFEKKIESLLSWYQISLETQMRWSDSIFDCVNLLYYKFHKINFKRSGSYIDSLGWIKKEKAKSNSKNDDDR